MTHSEVRARVDEVAETYVKLVLAVGQHDGDYVDAYYGPESWKEEAALTKRPLDDIKKQGEKAIDTLRHLATPASEEGVQLRHRYLLRQLQSLVSCIDLLAGRQMTFDEESKALYDAVAPTFAESHFKEILHQLGKSAPPEKAE